MKQRTRARYTSEDESMIHNTWVLVADQGSGRIFQRTSNGFDLVEEIDHPEGRKHIQEFNTDEPGNAFNTAGPYRHALVHENGVAQHAADLFAQKLCALLEKGRTSNKFNEVVLVAGPKFLGKLRSNLTEETQKLVKETLEKDFARVPNNAVSEKLSELL
jgi:protein required for attachment to host cells